VVGIIVVEVADCLGDMVTFITYRQLGQVPPLASSEARTCVSAPG
jgi:hypothetical protein